MICISISSQGNRNTIAGSYLESSKGAHCSMKADFNERLFCFLKARTHVSQGVRLYCFQKHPLFSPPFFLNPLRLFWQSLWQTCLYSVLKAHVEACGSNPLPELLWISSFSLELPTIEVNTPPTPLHTPSPFLSAKWPKRLRACRPPWFVPQTSVQWTRHHPKPHQPPRWAHTTATVSRPSLALSLAHFPGQTPSAPTPLLPRFHRLPTTTK